MPWLVAGNGERVASGNLSEWLETFVKWYKEDVLPVRPALKLHEYLILQLQIFSELASSHLPPEKTRQIQGFMKLSPDGGISVDFFGWSDLLSEALSIQQFRVLAPSGRAHARRILKLDLGSPHPASGNRK